MAKDTKHEDRRVALPLRAFVGLRVFALLTLIRNTLYFITGHTAHFPETARGAVQVMAPGDFVRRWRKA